MSNKTARNSKSHATGKSYCKACNASFYPQKMKPATTFSGLNSTHDDYIDSFPKGDVEELCQRCLNSISGLNNDMGLWFKSTKSYEDYKKHKEIMKSKELNPYNDPDDIHIDYGEVETLGSPSDFVDDQYNGSSMSGEYSFWDKL